MEVLLINPQCRRGDDIKDNIVAVLYDDTRLRQRLWRVVAKYVDLEAILQWSGQFLPPTSILSISAFEPPFSFLTIKQECNECICLL